MGYEPTFSDGFLVGVFIGLEFAVLLWGCYLLFVDE